MQAWTLGPLAHQRDDVAAGILAVLQAAHEQEARWLQRPSQAHSLPTLQQLQRSEHFHLGAVQGDRILGVLVVSPDEEPGQLCISTLVVDPSAQRQGIARGLVLDALQRGPGVVFAVSAASGNVAALNLYRSLGFVAYRQGVLGPTQLPITRLRKTAGAADGAAPGHPATGAEP